MVMSARCRSQYSQPAAPASFPHFLQEGIRGSARGQSLSERSLSKRAFSSQLIFVAVTVPTIAYPLFVSCGYALFLSSFKSVATWRPPKVKT